MVSIVDDHILYWKIFIVLLCVVFCCVYSKFLSMVDNDESSNAMKNRASSLVIGSPFDSSLSSISFGRKLSIKLQDNNYLL